MTELECHHSQFPVMGDRQWSSIEALSQGEDQIIYQVLLTRKREKTPNLNLPRPLDHQFTKNLAYRTCYDTTASYETYYPVYSNNELQEKAGGT